MLSNTGLAFNTNVTACVCRLDGPARHCIWCEDPLPHVILSGIGQYPRESRCTCWFARRWDWNEMTDGMGPSVVTLCYLWKHSPAVKLLARRSRRLSDWTLMIWYLASGIIVVFPSNTMGVWWWSSSNWENILHTALILGLAKGSFFQQCFASLQTPSVSWGASLSSGWSGLTPWSITSSGNSE